jgi:hypothetical protein
VSAKKNAVRGRRIWRAGAVRCALLALVAASGCGRSVYLGNIGDGAASLLWSASFEPGDLSEWIGDGQGGMLNENINPQLIPTATTAVAHGGRYAGLMTLSPTAGMTSSNYLFRNAPSPKAAYYSAWFYVPSSVTVGTWLSLSHFRGSQTAGGETLSAIWDVNLYPRGDGSLAAQLFDYNRQQNWRQTFPLPVPFDTWVQFEVYFLKATDPTGKIQVWQDGTLIFERDGLATVTNDSFQWDAGGACDALTSSPATVYVDDAAISTVRVGPGS